MSSTVLSPQQVLEVERVLTDNLHAYYRGCPPSLDAIQGAFILSYLPPSPRPNAAVSTIDPVRMIEFAAMQVRELGGDSIYCDRLLGSLKARMPVSSLDQQISDCRLFMSVTNRAVL